MVSWTVSSLAGGAAISVTFSVTAATTITNSDYAATADGGISAVGQAAVTTQVYPSLVPDFTASPLSGPAPLAVTFSNSSAGATSYRWDYGDGITGTTTAPTHVHTYTQAGVYTVTLTASDGITSQTQTRPAYITATPPAGFPATGILDDFNRAGGAIGGNWSGTTAGYSLVSNQLEVNSGGDIYWQAAVFGPDQEVFVTLSAVGANGQELGLVLKAQSSSGYSQGLLEVFYDPVNEVVEVWTYTGAQGWLQRGMDIPAAFADGDRLGARATAAGQVEVYRNGTLLAARDVTAWPYYANGGYIGLFFINANTSLLDDFGGGTVGESPAPVAAFAASPLAGPAPLPVTFTNSSTHATSYLWDFGDTLTSTQSSPSHTYTLPGVYTVTLTVAGPGSSDTLTRPGYITVTAPITADFSAEPLAGPAPLAVTFTNSSTNATEYVWAYGDGITSTITATNHVYTYTQAGVYTVTLYASSAGDSDILVRPAYITVTDTAIEGLAAVNDSPTLLGETTTLTVTTSAGSNVSYDWAFGDGQSGSGAVVTHTYSQTGYYTAVVTASNPVSVVTATTAVTITGAAGLAISKTAPASVVAGEPVTYTLFITNSGPGPAANLLITDTLPISAHYVSGGDLVGDVISWTVPSLAGGAAISVTFTVTAATTITNSDYAVTADGGISAVGQEPVTTEIYPPIVPDFSAEPLSGTVPLTVTFVNSSTGASTYLWAYGDGITSTTTATTHVYTYTQAGVYTITLWAGNGAITVPLTRPAYITVTTAITRDWQVITTATTLPPVVGEHGLAYDSARNRAILYGGNADGWPYENSTWEFDGTDWISVTTTTTPAARYGAGLAYDNGSGSTILFGGSDETDTALAQTWEYTNTEWSQVFPTTSPLSRTYPCLVAAPTGAVYLFGGNDGEQAYDDLWRYDSGDWSLLPAGSEVPQARTLAAMAYDSTNGRLLLFGGRSVTGTVLSDFWAYDLAASSWSPVVDPSGSPPPRMAHSLTYDPVTGNAVLVGGIAVDGETVLTDTWHYNGGWTEADPSASPPRPAYHQAAYGDNAIILFSEGEVWKYE